MPQLLQLVFARLCPLITTVVFICLSSISVARADATDATKSPPTTQPTITPIVSQPQFQGAPPTWKLIVGKSVIVPVIDNMQPGGADADFGFYSKDRRMFFALQAFDIALPTQSQGDLDFTSAAVAFTKARLGTNYVNGTLVVEKDPRYAVQLRYNFLMCGWKTSALDRYKKVGKVLVRCESEELLDKPTAEQTAALDAIGDETTAKLLNAASVYSDATELRAKPSRPTAAAAKPAILSTPAFGKTTAAKETPADKLNHRAELALAQAEKLKTDGKDREAYDRFKFVAKEYAKTPSADPATTAVATYEADADFMAKYVGKAPSTQPAANSDKSPTDSTAKAKSLLSLAENYAAAGRIDLAKNKYQSVIDQYPNTPFADKARQKLDALSAN